MGENLHKCQKKRKRRHSVVTDKKVHSLTGRNELWVGLVTYAPPGLLSQN